MAQVANRMHLIDHESEHLVRGLATDVESALWRFDPIRQTKTLLDVQAQEGVVTLEGNVRGDMLRSAAAQIAASVPGVVRVINNLVSDSTLESDVAIAIAMDPDVKLSTDRLNIKSYLGLLHLSGIVADPELEKAEARVARIEELAAAVDGVHNVSNRLRAVEGTGDDAYAAPEPVEEEETQEVVGARAMGTLLSEEKRDKVRAWIKERAAAREAAAG